MTLDEITTSAIDPALALLPARMDSLEARVMLLAIGLQESKFRSRWQILSGGRKGPARGYWQFERGGGVRGTMLHVASRTLLRKVCEDRAVNYEPMAIWQAIERDDVLAAALARLLLWTDANPLPSVGDFMGAWRYYIRCWRPGKPHLITWPAHYAAAVAFVTGDTV
jgi:hypothetical protein